ncbi:MAG: type II secretion system F family protein [Candidatus Aminicenantes bacterium]|jgi:type IV pilus assembly protein PilC|nr:type II secretion system F family protein [Candidatus Aminicenantes bacterium]
MPYFTCRLATEGGKTFSQTILASSLDECRRRFEDEGLCVLSVQRDWKQIQVRLLPFAKKIKERDFIMFNQELMALIKAGYPILRGMEVIVSRIKNLPFKELLMDVEKSIRGGKALSESFAAHESQFGRVYTASLMAGERSGNLAGAISRYLTYARTVAQTKSRIRSALVYPTLLIVFALILLTILVNFILPRFAEFYLDFEAKLPAISRGLMSFALAVRRQSPVFLVLVLGMIIAYIIVRRKEEGRILIDRLKLRIPFARIIFIESGVSLYSRTLGLLLEAGISLLQAIGIARHAVPNRYLVRLTARCQDRIKNGQSLSETLSETGFFPPLSLDMLRIGETSANLEGMLAEVADFYEGRIRTRIDTLVSLIEPVIIIFMGLLAAAMLLSVYLPIFNIIQVAQ